MRRRRLVWGVLMSIVMAVPAGAEIAGAQVPGAVVAGAGAAREALVPGGAVTLLRVEAQGVQIYNCAAVAGAGAAWTFREPLATLLRDGATVGRHFAGPGWEMMDGSSVRGRVVAQAAGERAGDIPWLRLAVTGHDGTGVLTGVTGVARVSTRGGMFSGTCETVGAFHLEPYSAVYVFLGD